MAKAKVDKYATRRGSYVHIAKLDEEKVGRIKKRLRKGEKGKVLAEEFNVSKATISLIRTGQIWKHVR